MSFVYGCTISTCIKFFPDKRGMAGGMATAFYGISSVIMPPSPTYSTAAWSPHLLQDSGRGVPGGHLPGLSVYQHLPGWLYAHRLSASRAGRRQSACGQDHRRDAAHAHLLHYAGDADLRRRIWHDGDLLRLQPGGEYCRRQPGHRVSAGLRPLSVQYRRPSDRRQPVRQAWAGSTP